MDNLKEIIRFENWLEGRGRIIMDVYDQSWNYGQIVSEFDFFLIACIPLPNP